MHSTINTTPALKQRLTDRPWSIEEWLSVVATFSTSIPMEISRQKILALANALTYLVVSIAIGGWDTKEVFALCGTLSVPLVLIWFPEQFGSSTAYIGRGGRFTRESPPVLISFLGWLFLVVGLPLLAYLLH